MSGPSGSPGSGHTATRTNWYYKWYLNGPSTQRLRREGLGVRAIKSSAVQQIPAQPVCTRRPCLGRTGETRLGRNSRRTVRDSERTSQDHQVVYRKGDSPMLLTR